MTKLICDIDFICNHKRIYIALLIVATIISIISGLIFMYYSQKKMSGNVPKPLEKMIAHNKGSFAVSGKSST